MTFSEVPEEQGNDQREAVAERRRGTDEGAVARSPTTYFNTSIFAHTVVHEMDTISNGYKVTCCAVRGTDGLGIGVG